jgi:hypothetical protein
MTSVAMLEVTRQIDSLPMLHTVRPRRSVFTKGAPFDFYAARDGRLHANGQEFNVKGINWCGARLYIPCTMKCCVLEPTAGAMARSQVRYRW